MYVVLGSYFSYSTNWIVVLQINQFSKINLSKRCTAKCFKSSIVYFAENVLHLAAFWTVLIKFVHKSHLRRTRTRTLIIPWPLVVPTGVQTPGSKMANGRCNSEHNKPLINARRIHERWISVDHLLPEQKTPKKLQNLDEVVLQLNIGVQSDQIGLLAEKTFQTAFQTYLSTYIVVFLPAAFGPDLWMDVLFPKVYIISQVEHNRPFRRPDFRIGRTFLTLLPLSRLGRPTGIWKTGSVLSAPGEGVY